MRKNILITGMPKSGKSTVLNNIIFDIDKKSGFVTDEIRINGERIGFELKTHNNEKSILANIDSETNFKVSKYFVNIKNLDEIIAKVNEFDDDSILFLDEIGQMQLFSEKFKALTDKYLNSSNICVATLSKIYSNNFIEEIKNRNDISLIEITEENREEKEKYIKILLTKIAKAKRYVSEPNRFIINENGVTIKTDHGIRTIINKDEYLKCDCDFFDENKICSHVIAFEEYKKII